MKDNKGVLPPLVERPIPAAILEKIEAVPTKKPQVKRKRGDEIETVRVEPESEKTPTKKKKKQVRKQTKKPKKTPMLQDEPSDDEATLSDASHHSEPEQT